MRKGSEQHPTPQVPTSPAAQNGPKAADIIKQPNYSAACQTLSSTNDQHKPPTAPPIRYSTIILQNIKGRHHRSSEGAKIKRQVS